mmetsp:Transcript_24467/g.61944  ORF Transcript_24467/g.61944 Transcript_24467/m.61944 type:complete len:89 (+) Transcript_24467:173-439(+)
MCSTPTHSSLSCLSLCMIVCVRARVCEIQNAGVKLYIEGEWEGAKRVFEECERLCRVDPPRSVLTSFMAERGWVKPEEWEGYRALTEK